MKKYILIVVLITGLAACGEENESITSADEEIDGTELVDDNQVSSDGIIMEDEGYTLGPIPEDPLLNMYGEDSLDTEGNLVYPPRDTIYDNQ
jgi:hypothetical protein